MTRVVKGREVRKKEILETARQFFFEHGYEETTIQEIIDALGIAKGTFYHYFRSKMDLLDQMVEQTSDEMVLSMKPILESERNAIGKFNALFQQGTTFKMQNIDVFLVFLTVLFKDENTVIRDKIYRSMIRKNTPLLKEIIHQGVEEGSFETPYPEEWAEMIMHMGRSLNESICRLFLADISSARELTRVIELKMHAYQSAIERMLGVSEGSLRFVVPGIGKIVKAFSGRLSRKEKDGEKKER